MSRAWKPVGEYGWKCEDYSIGKIFLEGCTLFEVWHGKEMIATCNDFDEARAAARAHYATMMAGAA